jgi:hypothetical protein
MQVCEVVIAMLLGGAILATIARRFGAPYPALVALAGAALALVPGLSTLAAVLSSVSVTPLRPGWGRCPRGDLR